MFGTNASSYNHKFVHFIAYSAGLNNLVAKTEDEYVQLALDLASDIPALSKLRTSLRELMLKSPVCDGAKFTRGLELKYRDLWRRYCKGDVPSLRRLEMLQVQKPDLKSVDHDKDSFTKEAAPASVKINGVSRTPGLPSKHVAENGNLNAEGLS